MSPDEQESWRVVGCDDMPPACRAGVSVVVLITIQNKKESQQWVALDKWDAHARSWYDNPDVDGSPLRVTAWKYVHPFLGKAQP